MSVFRVLGNPKNYDLSFQNICYCIKTPIEISYNGACSAPQQIRSLMPHTGIETTRRHVSGSNPQKEWIQLHLHLMGFPQTTVLLNSYIEKVCGPM